MNEYKVVDGWEIIPKGLVSENIKDITSRDGDDGKEQDRLVDILEDLLTYAPDEISYYFSEDHNGREGFMDSDEFYKIWGTVEGLRTVYDSSLLNCVPDTGYNIIETGYAKWDEETKSRDVYVALSMNGCSLASALTEYYKFTLTFD